MCKNVCQTLRPPNSAFLCLVPFSATGHGRATDHLGLWPLRTERIGANTNKNRRERTTICPSVQGDNTDPPARSQLC